MKQGRIINGENEVVTLIQNVHTVAVVGMKDESDPDKPAHQIPKMVQAKGIRVIPVNPKVQNALGEKAYPQLADVPDPFDTVNVFRRSEVVEALADEILALPETKRPSLVWMQTGVQNDEAAKKLVAGGINVVMDLCLGVYVSRYRR